MRRQVQTQAAAAIAAVLLGVAQPAQASVEPRWADFQLAGFADVILAGRVVDLRAGTDPVVNAIYTYVTVDVSRVLKGAVTGAQVVVKELGGETATRGLRVPGQASFTLGEDVLLFLEVRPRDGTLYTVALWQGKWTVERINGILTAVRHEHGSTIRSQWVLDRLAALIQRLDTGRDVAPVVNAHPADAAAAIAQPYKLFDPPFRYHFSPLVDVQSGGQSGLPGGGFAELAAAGAKWNNAGSSFVFREGSLSGPARCYDHELGNGRVTISFNDPCQEIADDGGTLAVGGSYYDPSRGSTVNGVFFHEATEGFVVNNDSAVALSYLRNSNCFADIQLHELGHVLGLDHSSVNDAIMYPTLSSACTAGARDLAADDVQGLLAIYPPPIGGITPPGTAPANLTVVVNGTSSITVSFDPVTSDVRFATSAATSYRLDFATAPTGPVVASLVATTTTVTIPIPPGLVGTFYVSVTGINSTGPGPSSLRVAFTIVGCAAPPAPTGLIGSVIGGTATAMWNPSAGAASYVVQAGSAPGRSDYANVNIGNATSVSAGGLAPGFLAYVRVIAVNACGPSAPSGEVLLQ
jgi:hypothetical protein